MTGDLTISKANSLLILNKSASTQFTSIRGNLNGVRRWAMFLGGTAAEGGANTGSEFSINRYADAGTALGAALTIDRATGDTSIPSALSVGGALTVAAAPTADLQVANKMYVDDADALKVAKAGDTMTGVLLMPGGTAALPSIAMGQTNAGMFSAGTNSVGLSINGSARLTVTASTFQVAPPIRAPAGTITLPAYSFTTDTDSGLYLPALGEVRMAINGVDSLTWTPTAITAAVSIVTPTPTMGDNTTKAATTAFVRTAITNSLAYLETLTAVDTIALSTGVAANIASISLTAGDWDVDAATHFYSSAGTTNTTTLETSVSQISATRNLAVGAFAGLGFASHVLSASGRTTIQAPTGRVNLGSTTTLYCVAYAAFTVSTLVAGGYIRARRCSP